MDRHLLIIGMLLICSLASAQQFMLEGFGTWNKTSYGLDAYSENASYLGYGGRVALGSDHVQLGGEYLANLTHPEFEGIIGTTSFEETYYGGFVRAKISRYPAMRFGLVLRAGAGLYNTDVVWDTSLGADIKETYDPILGFNAGAGFSIPMFKHTMLELGYTYNYLKRPDLSDGGVPLISEHDAAYHLISAGLSLNFVFGKRAEQYRHARENQRFKNGWRG